MLVWCAFEIPFYLLLKGCIGNLKTGVCLIVQLRDRSFHVTESMEKCFLEEKFKAVDEKLEQMKLDVSQNKEGVSQNKEGVSQNREEIAKVNVL